VVLDLAQIGGHTFPGATENPLRGHANASNRGNDPEHDENACGRKERRRQMRPEHQKGCDGTERDGKHQKYHCSDQVRGRNERPERIFFQFGLRE
jgi:hypothetical protein